MDTRALILVDIAPQMEDDGLQRILSFMNEGKDGFESLEQVAQSIAGYQPHRKQPRNLEGLAKNLRLDENGRYQWHWDPRFLMRAQDFAQRRIILDNAARKITAPTLLVRGQFSDILSPSGVEEFIQRCPHAEFVDVAGAGHMVAGDRNDVFDGAIVEFLTRVAPVR